MESAVEKAIRTALLANGSITALTSTRITASIALPGAALPFIVYQHMSGGDDNETPLQSADYLYLVKAVGLDATAVTLAGHIRTTLHRKTLTMDPPFITYNCRQETPVRYPETIERITYWHMGAVYRIRISE